MNWWDIDLGGDKYKASKVKKYIKKLQFCTCLRFTSEAKAGINENLWKTTFKIFEESPFDKIS